MFCDTVHWRKFITAPPPPPLPRPFLPFCAVWPLLNPNKAQIRCASLQPKSPSIFPLPPPSCSYPLRSINYGAHGCIRPEPGCLIAALVSLPPPPTCPHVPLLARPHILNPPPSSAPPTPRQPTARCSPPNHTACHLPHLTPTYHRSSRKMLVLLQTTMLTHGDCCRHWRHRWMKQ